MSNLRALLLMGGPEYHNHVVHFAELAGIVAGEGEFDLRITTDLGVLTTDTLADYQAVINWSTFVQPTSGQVAALLAAVEGGMGFLGLHAASATFWNSADYLTMLGSRFLRHGPYREFLVEIDDRSHPITRGVDDFRVEDELYELGGDTAEFPRFANAVASGNPLEGELASLGEGPLDPGIHVLASAEGHPLLYTKSFGKGRVQYNALGHDIKALGHPSFRRLVVQGLQWVTAADA